MRAATGVFNSNAGSSIKLQVNGVIQASVGATGLFDISGTLIVSDGGEVCDASTEGAIRYNSTGAAHDYCDGTAWSPIAGGVDSVTGAAAPNFNFLLNEVTDVSITSPVGGECLVFNGSNWANSTTCASGIDSVVGAGIPILPDAYANIQVVVGAATPAFNDSLSDLQDVSTTAPTNSDVLTWNSTTSS